MKRQRLLSIAVVALLVLNIATLGLVFFREPGPPEHGRHEGPKAIIIERLKFDAQQVSAYEELIHAHRRMIRELDDRMMALRGRLYQNHDSLQADSLIRAIGAVQEEVEHVHAAHFA